MPLIQLFTVSFTKMYACCLECFTLLKKSLFAEHLYLQCLLLPVSFPSLLLSVFPRAPLRVSILFFQTKLLLSLHCLVPTCWLCFPSPGLQSGDTGGSGLPHCVFDHSCDLQQTCTHLGERKCMRQPRIHSGGVGGRFSSPCRL